MRCSLKGLWLPALTACLIVLCLGSVPVISAPESAMEVPLGVSYVPDVIYRTVNQAELKLDLARPAAGSGPFPAVVILNGGCWMDLGGDRKACLPLLLRLAQQGYVAIAVSHRSAATAPFPARIHDAKAAVRWLRSRAAVAAVCALWAASLYAHNLGIRTAENDVQNLYTRTAVAVYSTEPLALSGPGLTVQRLPAAYQYHYRYEGLRLLLMRSGTYYLLPVDWNPRLDLTYILDQSDLVRIELLGAQA